jgi:omega-amidase
MKTFPIEVYQFKTVDDFEQNYQKLLSLYEENSAITFALAPEVCLSGFCYDRMDEAAIFSSLASERLKTVVKDKALALTMIEKEEDSFYNVAKVFYQGEVVYSQKKAKLFLLGDEHNHFEAGEKSAIQIFEFLGIKMAFLVCFELRFVELWKQVEGAELILVPAMWGANRAEHYQTLTKALAIVNRTFVMASDSSNSNMAKESGIINPFGVEIRNNDKEILEAIFDQREILKMKRFIPYE